tara:strand:+ start:736 stop:1668 length:933 start_codon:yes stop_codon:yes gene_type:complete
MVEIKGTLFTGVYDNKTDKIIELPSFEHFENALYKMSEKPRDKKEDSELMSPATYIPNTTRANDNVLNWAGWCAVDVDDANIAVDLKDYVATKVGDNYCICYSTASSTEMFPKFRLVFPLTEYVQRENIKHFWYALNKELGEVGDIQTKDLSRMYYLPAKYKDKYNFIFTHTGSYMDPNVIMSKHEYVEKSGNTMFDKLPKAMQDAMMEHMKNKLTNTQVKWTSYKDCPFFPKQLEEQYRTISGSGWYHKMYQIMVALAGNAIKNNYPITATEIAYLCRELDIDTGNWYEKRPLDKEAERALEYVYKNQF